MKDPDLQTVVVVGRSSDETTEEVTGPSSRRSAEVDLHQELRAAKVYIAYGELVEDANAHQVASQVR